MAPAQVQAGARHPGFNGLFIQFEFQTAEYRHLHGILFRRVVDVAVAPEAEIKIDLEPLARPDTFQETFHVTPHRRRQVFLAPQFPENGFRMFVMPEREQRGCIVEPYPVQFRPFHGKLAQDHSRMGRTSHFQQGLRCEEAYIGGIDIAFDPGGLHDVA